jgi:nucleoid-associated protein YgaU
MPNQMLGQQAQDELTQIQCYQLQAVLERMIKNIQLINSAPNAIFLTVSNANLFNLALQYYGDTDYWVTIAEANSLTSNLITEETTIIIPPKPTVDPKGVYSD